MDPSADPSATSPADCPPVPPGAVPLYGLDIETDTSVDGLDPSCARVVAVALCGADGDEVFLGDEVALLDHLDRRLAELEPGVLVTWNGAGFDLPFLAARAAACGAQLQLQLWDRADGGTPAAPWPPPPDGVGASWGAHGHLDGYRTYRADVRRSLGVSCGLKSMARLVGLDPVEVDLDRLHTLDQVQLADYVASDARLARALVQRRGPAALCAVDRPRAGPVAPLPVLSTVPPA